MTFALVRSVISFAFLAMVYAIAIPAAQAKDQYHFKLMPQDGQELTWTRGVASIDNPASASIVRLIDSRDKLPDDQTTFRVTVLNTGHEPVEVNSENIWIEASAGNRVAMLSHQELVG